MSNPEDRKLFQYHLEVFVDKLYKDCILAKGESYQCKFDFHNGIVEDIRIYNIEDRRYQKCNDGGADDESR